MAEKEKAIVEDGRKRSGARSNNNIKKDGFCQVTLKSLCSGFGQFHSPNHPKKPRNYTSTNIEAIKKMAEQPPALPKSRGQWVIFSDLMSRCHREQLEKGRFFALWADVDKIDVMTFDQAIGLTLCVLPYHFISYTTANAAWFKQKFRLILPLAISIPGKFFVICQKILNDKLESIGIEPDRASERPGQICYLPNKGEFYRYKINDGAIFHPGAWKPEIREHLQKKSEVKPLRPNIPKTNSDSLIDRFNSINSVESALESYGYTKRGKKWLSPNSESKQPGVTIDAGKWFSCHGNDAGIGRTTSAGCFGDSFDLFVHYEHNGNRGEALKAVGRMIGGQV